MHEIVAETNVCVTHTLHSHTSLTSHITHITLSHITHSIQMYVCTHSQYTHTHTHSYHNPLSQVEVRINKQHVDKESSTHVYHGEHTHSNKELSRARVSLDTRTWKG